MSIPKAIQQSDAKYIDLKCIPVLFKPYLSRDTNQMTEYQLGLITLYKGQNSRYSINLNNTIINALTKGPKIIAQI